MILLRLFFEFFKTGLFAVGGGLATIPFLQAMGAATGWFTDSDLTTMIAVSESTPGPIGVNMATYVGFQTAGMTEGVIRGRHPWTDHPFGHCHSHRCRHFE